MTLLLQIMVVAAVTFSKPAGTYREPFITQLIAPTSKARIIYTLDGSEPMADSECRPTNGLSMDPGRNLVIKQTVTVRAFACHVGMQSSLESSAAYVVDSKDAK